MEYNKKSLNELIFTVDMMLHRAQGGRNHGSCFMGNQMEQVLILLQAKQSATSKELLEELELHPKDLNKWLERLEDGGLIELNTAEEDKTLLKAELTQAGKKAARKAEQRRAEAAKAFECLSEEEKENLQKILLHLAEDLEMKLKEEDDPDRDDFWDRSDLWDREGLWNKAGIGNVGEFCNRNGHSHNEMRHRYFGGR
ncbi:helix-turn-helix domain-containing protein [Anaerocolumna xylanovorans]|uniref:DNA-binding transcriptional regulator, MarR family n=1 Tax=Anaerocolumna xylanovorans DSM 12503 TaxID=1121345 RepID=A0A1M7XYX4_9FIRM|nr:hypothetical protein [Anaerocolumna xylanovorans]SHO44284.1 DNA-binding transcriptional regulator, MarR family [Anaerocolumna xylanovorans DSM 12503]